MNAQHKAIRALLTTMAPKRAINYIQAFDLPTDEANCIIEREVRGKSIVQISQDLNMSVETVKNNRRMAFIKISDAISHGCA